MRRSRRNYVIYVILWWIIFYVFLFIRLSTMDYMDYSYSLKSYEEAQIFYIILVNIFYNICKIYLTAGRLNDMGKSHNMAFLVIIPLVWLYFAFAKGTEGDNEYGKSPKDLRAEKKAQEAEQLALINPTDIDLVLQNMEQFCSPNIGRIESINFRMNRENERYFYAIPPERVKKLRQRLEVLAKRLQDNANSYGYLYAERRFYIGDKLMFSWSNEMKI